MRMTVVLVAVIAVVGLAAAADGPASAPAADGLRLAALPSPHALGGAALQATDEESAAFTKVYIRRIFREIVWFNGREGDLERHAVRRHGHIYIILTDLMRHLGGDMAWGPRASFLQVKRGGVTVRFIPGSAKVIVDGQARKLAGPTFRVAGRLWAPAKSTAEVFGAEAEWNTGLHRLEVTVR